VAEQSWRELNAPELMRDVYNANDSRTVIAVQMKLDRQGRPPESFYRTIEVCIIA
jgi:hypothetical protein